MPPCFRRIRHLGFWGNRNKKEALAALRESLNAGRDRQPVKSRAEILAVKFGEASRLHCRACRGPLELVETFEKQRAPPAMAG